MRSLGLRALLLSVLLCGVVFVLGLLHSTLFVVLWVFWFPGIAAVAYPLGISGFDTELYPRSALLMMFVNVLFWWLVIYLLMWFVAYLRNRSQPK
jgi:hypothetical protein